MSIFPKVTDEQRAGVERLRAERDRVKALIDKAIAANDAKLTYTLTVEYCNLVTRCRMADSLIGAADEANKVIHN